MSRQLCTSYQGNSKYILQSYHRTKDFFFKWNFQCTISFSVSRPPKYVSQAWISCGCLECCRNWQSSSSPCLQIRLLCMFRSLRLFWNHSGHVSCYQILPMPRRQSKELLFPPSLLVKLVITSISTPTHHHPS